MKIAFIGGGNMGAAILAAVLKNGLASPADVSVSDVSPERRLYVKEQFGVSVTDSNAGVIAGKDVIILAVKPQGLDLVMADVKGRLREGRLVLSIVAGITLKALVNGLSYNSIVRAMPNTPAQVGYGISGWTATPGVSDGQKRLARSILGSMGKEIYFEREDSLDMVTAVSGSGPAYFFLFAEALIEAAVKIGLDREAAGELVGQTMLGAARLLETSGESAAELRRKVTSPGGTTERALGVFQEAGLAGIVDRAIRAALDRARELGSSREHLGD